MIQLSFHQQFFQTVSIFFIFEQKNITQVPSCATNFRLLIMQTCCYILPIRLLLAMFVKIGLFNYFLRTLEFILIHKMHLFNKSVRCNAINIKQLLLKNNHLMFQIGYFAYKRELFYMN